MKSTIWLSSVKFKNGTVLNLQKNAIVVFVGPNNSGKSQTLRELERLIKVPQETTYIVENIELSVEGDANGYLERIKNRKVQTTYRPLDPSLNLNVMPGEIENAWNRIASGDQHSHWPISNFCIKNMTTLERLSIVTPPGNIDFINEVRMHPIHTLKEESDKELLFSDYFKQAFGEDIIVNHGAGSVIPLHVGKRPKTTVKNDRVSTVYQQALRELPQLDKQGDGMKSFAGVFLNLFTEDFPINLIDEPEAFLHPPQASLLGQMVAQTSGDDKQIFIATHSEDFLKGMLDRAADRLMVIRIQRDGKGNKINVLENSELREIWSDSLLRHSNILDGLFHKRVVLVESDSDSRFYSAIADSIVEAEKASSPDLLFVQSGGKHRFPIVIRALKKLEVPLTIVGDFDLYHDENPIKPIFEELGGKWSEIKDDVKKVKKAIDEKRPELQADELKIEIEKIFSSFKEKIIPDDKIKAIQTVLKKSSPWSQAKASGKAYLTAGESTQAFHRVQEKLAKKSFHILDMGEIEAFDKSIGGHGPKWVAQVLTKDLEKSPDLAEARTFVKKKILRLGDNV